MFYNISHSLLFVIDAIKCTIFICWMIMDCDDDVEDSNYDKDNNVVEHAI